MQQIRKTLFNEVAYLNANPDASIEIRLGKFSTGEAHWWLKGKQLGKLPHYNLEILESEQSKSTVVIETSNDLSSTKASIQSLLDQTTKDFKIFVIVSSQNKKIIDYLIQLSEFEDQIFLIPSNFNNTNIDNKNYLLDILNLIKSEFTIYLDSNLQLQQNAIELLTNKLIEDPELAAAYSNCFQRVKIEFQEIEDSSLAVPSLIAYRSAIITNSSWSNYDSISQHQLFKLLTVSRKSLHVTESLANRLSNTDQGKNTIGVEFDEKAYLTINSDVAEAIDNKIMLSGEEHWWTHGRNEGRYPCFMLPDINKYNESKDDPTLPWLSIVVAVTTSSNIDSSLSEMCSELADGIEIILVEHNLDSISAINLWEAVRTYKNVRLVSTKNTCGQVSTELCFQNSSAKHCIAVPFGLKFSRQSLLELREELSNATDSNCFLLKFETSKKTFWTACVNKDIQCKSLGAWWGATQKVAGFAEKLTEITLGSMERVPHTDEYIYSLYSSQFFVPQFQSDKNIKKKIPQYVEIISCRLNSDARKRYRGQGCCMVVLKFRTPDGCEVEARMKLHLTEKLDNLVIADPRVFADRGYEINSINSPLLLRRRKFGESNQVKSIFLQELPDDVDFYYIKESDIASHLNSKYDLKTEGQRARNAFVKKPAIAFLVNNPAFLGGGTAIALRYCQWLTDLGIDVTVYADTPVLTKLRANVKSIFCNDPDRLAGMIKEPVVMIFSVFEIESLLNFRNGDKLLIHMGQGYEQYQYGDTAFSVYEEKPTIELFEGVPVEKITVSYHLREIYHFRHSMQSQLIMNGIDLNVFSPNEIPLARNNSQIRILSIGHPYHPVKGVRELNQAITEFALRHPNLQIFWQIANGTDAETPTNHLGGADNLKISFIGNLTSKEVATEMRKHDIFVNPSYYEGFGLPTIEAMACGTPVIAASNLGLDYIVESEKHLLICPPGDSQALLHAIERLYFDQKLAQKLRSNSLELIKNYGLDQQYDQFIEAFQNLLEYKFSTDKIVYISEQLKLSAELAPVNNSSINNLNRNPLVTVVIPAYNREDFIGDALESVLAQSFQNWEAVVVDDGSSDNTVLIANQYADRDSRIKVIKHETNRGIAAALNTGILAMQGEFFSWLSSDDLFHKDILKEELEAFSRLSSDYGLVYSSFDLLDQESVTIQRLPEHYQVQLGLELGESFKFDYIHGCTAMIKKQVLDEVGGFQPLLRHGQDSEMWMRIASAGYHFHYVPKKLLLNRVHGGQSSATNMIRCRFDSIVAHWFYLTKLSLFEVYRNICIWRSADRRLFVNHIVQTFSHPEASVNSPILGMTFIDWICQGLKIAEPKIQKEILQNIADGLEQFRNANPRVQKYISKIKSVISQPLDQEEQVLDFRLGERKLTNINWRQAKITNELFEWACKLLLDPKYPSIGTELYNAHATHLWCQQPYAVAHALIAYLANWEGSGYEYLKVYEQISKRPTTAREAENLFIRIVMPSVAEKIIKYEKNERLDLSDISHEFDLLSMYVDIHEREQALKILLDITLSPRMLNFLDAINKFNKPRTQVWQLLVQETSSRSEKC